MASVTATGYSLLVMFASAGWRGASARSFAVFPSGFFTVWRGYRAEQGDDDETETTCPCGWQWCVSNADLSTDDAILCLSCWLRADRDDEPYPDAAFVADAGQARHERRKQDVEDDGA